MTAARRLSQTLAHLGDNCIAADAKTKFMPIWNAHEKAVERLIKENEELRARRA